MSLDFAGLILFYLLFIPSIFIAFYVPGRVILGKDLRFPFIVSLIASILLGIVLWGWQGYILGYLNLRFLSYGYLALFSFLFLKKKYHKEFRTFKIKSVNLLFFFLIILGTIAQNLAYFWTGFISENGIQLTNYNRSDHIWHIALTSEIVKHFPPFEPGMYGIPLKNYHYWFNLVTGELVRVFHLPLFQTQFAGMYVLCSILLGLSIFLLAFIFKRGTVFILWLLFFFYFSGDAIYWLTFIVTRIFQFSLSPIVDGTIFMDNPPRAFSTIIAILGIFLLFSKNKSKYKWLIICGLVIGSIVGFKIYMGIAVLAGLFVLSFYKAFKKNYTFLILSLLSLIFALIVYLPINYGSGGLFFLAFDIPRDFLTQDTIGLKNIELAFEIYRSHGNIPRIIEYGGIMSLIFLFAQLGIKLVGFIQTKNLIKKIGIDKSIFIFAAAVSSLLLGFLTYQTSGSSNVFNFIIVLGVFLSILASLTLDGFWNVKNKIIYLVLAAVIVSISIPRWYIRTITTIDRDYKGGFSGVGKEEFISYNFFSKTPKESLILVDNIGHLDYLSPSVAVMSGRNTYLSGQWIIDSHNTTNRERMSVVNKIFTSKNHLEVKNLLRSQGISYVYFYDKDYFNFSKSFFPVVFQNSAGTIIKVE